MCSAPVSALNSKIFNGCSIFFDKSSMNRFGKLVELSGVVNLALNRAFDDASLSKNGF
jgi:hypothetical protein